MVSSIDLTHADDATTTASSIRSSKEHIFKSMMPLNPIPNTGVTLHQYVLHDIEKHVNRVALVDTSDGRQYTYGEVQRLAKNVAAGMANQFHIQKGDVVFILLPNVAEYFIFVLGIISIGAVFSGSNPSAHRSEIAKQVEDSEAKLIITNSKAYEKVDNLGLPVVILGDHEGLQLSSSSSSSSPGTTHSYRTLFKADGSLAPEVEISQHDVCALPYSSGTTGVSKGVMLTHRNLVTNLCQTLADMERGLASGAIPEGESVTLGLMPFFHIYGISGICCASMRLKGKVLVIARYLLAYSISTIHHTGKPLTVTVSLQCPLLFF
jgi:4-coumarate--CoA ligase